MRSTRFKERLARRRESIKLIHLLWREYRVTFKGEHYRTTKADGPRPIRPQGAGLRSSQRAARREVAGREKDGLIYTSGKGMDLYIHKLLPRSARALPRQAENIHRSTGRSRSSRPATSTRDRRRQTRGSGRHLRRDLLFVDSDALGRARHVLLPRRRTRYGDG